MKNKPRRQSQIEKTLKQKVTALEANTLRPLPHTVWTTWAKCPNSTITVVARKINLAYSHTYFALAVIHEITETEATYS